MGGRALRGLTWMRCIVASLSSAGSSAQPGSLQLAEAETPASQPGLGLCFDLEVWLSGTSKLTPPTLELKKPLFTHCLNFFGMLCKLSRCSAWRIQA